ncbi:PAS domain-containing protein [Paraburkholderia panacisoli]|uniref:PAS domain-containing protein n=1 Tax=Paraburkholderia panacisoli TaxID=2603818 RepID=A0A5B0G1M3_9BURK|nr:PAS domain-containing protein [Paraburkholderia panacisoli]
MRSSRRQPAKQAFSGRCRVATVQAFHWATETRRRSHAHHDGTQQRSVLTGRISGQQILEDRFPELWELLPLGVLVLDDRGDILLANLHTEELFGYRRGELIGEPVFRLIPNCGSTANPPIRMAVCPRQTACPPVPCTASMRCARTDRPSRGKSVSCELPLMVAGRSWCLSRTGRITMRCSETSRISPT